jgi:hypothetical protein
MTLSFQRFNMTTKTLLVLLTTSISTTLYAADAPTPPTDAILKKFTGVDATLDDAVKAASVSRQQDPIKFICRDMKTVVGDLDEYQTGKPTQTTEAAVVSQLDVLIAELEKECKNGKPGSALNPSKPMPDSKLGGGPG